MITKKALAADRIRGIDGGFSFIPHRFLTDGFLKTLSQQELLLYIFLVLAADRYGLSFYSRKSSKNLSASERFWNPKTTSSAYLTIIMSPLARLCLHCCAQRSST